MIRSNFIANQLYNGTRRSFFAFVQQTEVCVFERFGRYNRTAKPGINFFIPIIETGQFIPTNIQQQEHAIRVKTKDNAFVDINASVHYKVTDVIKACYELDSPTDQIKALIENVIRAEAPKSTLEELFSSQESISNIVKNELGDRMEEFGYEITDTLITNIEPDPIVGQSMNSVLAAEREKEAAYHRSEALRVEMIATAKADKERKELQGKGIAAQRKAVMEGYVDCINNLTSTGMAVSDAVELTISTQKLDTVERMARDGEGKIIFMPTDTLDTVTKSVYAANVSSST